VTDEHPPGPLTSLDDELRRVRFEPRASLGAELAGRARRGEQPVGAVHPWQSFRVRSAMALVGVAAAAALVVGATPLPRNIDLCCQDFDGGRDENDGIRIRISGFDDSHAQSRFERDESRAHIIMSCRVQLTLEEPA